MRLDKYLSNMKYGSRNEIKAKIKAGRVEVNGEIVKNAGCLVKKDSDQVVFDGNEVFFKENVLIMLHKPSGYISSNEVGLHKNVFELIGEPYNRLDLKIAGRLDIDTEGLMLLTDNGKLVHDIISPKKRIYKRYYVKTENSFDISVFSKNIIIKDGKNMDYTPLKPLVEYIDDTSFYLSIMEGKFHQVKRMVEYFGNTVTYLKRVSIGTIELDSELQIGDYKEIEFKI